MLNYVPIPERPGCRVAVRIGDSTFEIRYMGSARDLIAAGLTSAATVNANAAVSTSRCCVVYHVDPLQALCLPGVAEVLAMSEGTGAEHHGWMLPEAAAHGS